METIKLKKSGNFMWVTDLKTNTTTRFPAKDTYYAFEDKNRVLVLTWDKNNGETYHRYKVSQLVDLDEEPFINFAALDTFLAANLGFNGGGGTPVTTPKMFTALISQTGEFDKQSLSSGAVTKGVTYKIDGDSDGDFSNVGAPNNDDLTSFVATIDGVPNSYGSAELTYDLGAPTVIILENTIGNIWFEYSAEGLYLCKSSTLFTLDKTTIDMDAYCQNGNPASQLIYKDLTDDVFTIGTHKDGLFNGHLTNNRLEIKVYN